MPLIPSNTLRQWRQEATDRLNAPNPFFKRQLDLLDAYDVLRAELQAAQANATIDGALAVQLAEEYSTWLKVNHVAVISNSVQHRISQLGQRSLDRRIPPPKQWARTGKYVYNPAGLWACSFDTEVAAQTYVDHMNTQQQPK